MEIYLIAAVILFVGAFTQGLTGFGLALVSVPLLSLVMEPKLAVPIAAFYGWLVTFPIIYKMYQHVYYRLAILMFMGAIPGVLIGADLLKNLPSWIILSAMGATLIFSSVYSLFFKQGSFYIAKQWLNNLISIFAGFFAGILGGSVGEPGPPVIAYLAFQRWKSDRIKATLTFFFMLQMSVTILRYWQQDMMGSEVRTYLIYIVPGFIFGLILGLWSYGKLTLFSIDYHRLVHLGLLLIGISLIIKGLIH